MKEPVRMYRWMFTPLSLYGSLAGASMFLIGRALMRRQRWGAYLAGFTLGMPLIRQFVMPDAAILSIPGIVFTTLALGAIVTVWDELGTVRDTEFVDPDNDDDEPLPTRNRGFGEQRRLGPESTPEFARSPERVDRTSGQSRINQTPLNPADLPVNVNAITFGVPLITMGLVVSLWRELGTVRNSELAQHGPEPERFEPFTRRNRAYGEARGVSPNALPPHSASTDSMSIDVRNSAVESILVPVGTLQSADNS